MIYRRVRVSALLDLANCRSARPNRRVRARAGHNGV